jgi:hypothetical protein
MDLASDGSQVLALKPVTSSFRLLAFLPDEGKGGAKRCGGKGRNDRERGMILPVEVTDYCVKRVAGQVEIELDDKKLHDKL